MEYTVKFTPHIQLGILEAKQGRRYSNQQIAEAMNGGITRQIIHYQLNTSLEEVRTEVIARWLKFFNDNEMPVTVNDLFTVSKS